MLAKAFGPAFESIYYGPITTCGQLTELLGTPGFGDKGCFLLVEVVLLLLDAPKAVIKTGAAIDKFNKSKLEKKNAVQGA
jgi:pyruvate decarboxylase